MILTLEMPVASPCSLGLFGENICPIGEGSFPEYEKVVGVTCNVFSALRVSFLWRSRMGQNSDPKSDAALRNPHRTYRPPVWGEGRYSIQTPEHHGPNTRVGWGGCLQCGLGVISLSSKQHPNWGYRHGVNWALGNIFLMFLTLEMPVASPCSLGLFGENICPIGEGGFFFFPPTFTFFF